ncbi:two-component sensor histidine kinase [Devosia sp. BK]|uniref:sensor histidine kinase n=1 Tax=Devosia sp. BK TaxID=2871706 RepID=UPI00293A53EC|nr:ATP-binding protein [Devosia sp. BK]MDV3253256.1 two-component sensor histidine kinase [Devosia sp. BK]
MIRARLLTVISGILVVLAAGASVLIWNLANAYESFDATALSLQGRASALVEQHIALSTALAAILQSGDGQMFQDAAEAIEAAYPRVISIEATSSETSGLKAGRGEQYSFITVSEGLGVDLTIDAGDLLPQDLGDIVANLALPDGTLLVGPPIEDPEFVGALESASQPLVLSATVVPELTSLLPIWPTLAVSGLTLVIYCLALIAWQQWHTARRAERRALRGENLARLEHASRVNGLGEMASGIAHELTQPLTAILSQAQAGRRLLARGDVAVLEPILDETILQTKRASAILAKLRQWVRLENHEPAVVSLADAISSVESLVRGDLAARHINLVQVHADPLLTVRADAVQLEQVIFNLVRNAMDAIADARGTITVSTRRDGETAVVDIVDTGRGVDDSVKAHLFEPFITSKPAGMGLGLALCQRLVERMGGSLSYVESENTTFRIVLPVSGRAE